MSWRVACDAGEEHIATDYMTKSLLASWNEPPQLTTTYIQRLIRTSIDTHLGNALTTTRLMMARMREQKQGEWVLQTLCQSSNADWRHTSQVRCLMLHNKSPASTNRSTGWRNGSATLPKARFNDITHVLTIAALAKPGTRDDNVDYPSSRPTQ